MDHFKLKAPYSLCDPLPFTNGSGSTIESGTWRVEGGVLGMVMQDVADGDTGIMVVRVPPSGILIPKEATTVTFAVGEYVYWDVADGEANDDAVNNKPVGIALEAAGATDAEVRIALLPLGPVS